HQHARQYRHAGRPAGGGRGQGANVEPLPTHQKPPGHSTESGGQVPVGPNAYPTRQFHRSTPTLNSTIACGYRPLNSTATYATRVSTMNASHSHRPGASSWARTRTYREAL